MNNAELLSQKRKQYYNINKDKELEKMNNYYQSNKDYLNKKITCNICGCQICRQGIAKHQKSKKCKSYVKPIEKPHPNDNYIIVGGRVYLKGESPLEGVWHCDHTPFEVKYYTIFENGVERGVKITTI